MSEPRKLEVLRAIVEDYVHSREPVGSKALRGAAPPRACPAPRSATTWRRWRKRASSPRRTPAPGASPPTRATGSSWTRFRRVKPLSPAERRAIQALLEGSDDLDDVLDRTVRLLAQLTNQVAVVQYPHLSRAKVRHIEFVLLAPRKVLAVLIADTGKVEQRVIDVGAGHCRRSPGRTAHTVPRQPLRAPPLNLLPQSLQSVVASCPPARRSRRAGAGPRPGGAGHEQPRGAHGHGRDRQPGPLQRATSRSASARCWKPSRSRWSCSAC